MRIRGNRQARAVTERAITVTVEPDAAAVRHLRGGGRDGRVVRAYRGGPGQVDQGRRVL